MTTRLTINMLIARIQADPELAAHLAAELVAWDAARATGASMEARLERVGLRTTDKRREALTAAHKAGVDDETFCRLVEAHCLSQGEEIELPLRYGHTSRAKSWARLGRGESAQWGKVLGPRVRVDQPGEWVVSSSDGFRRTEKKHWIVQTLEVGDQIWTIANPRQR